MAKLLWRLYLSVFWSTSNTSQMFSKSQQKRQVLGDLRVYRVWPEEEKNGFAETFGLFCLFAVFDPNPN